MALATDRDNTIAATWYAWGRNDAEGTSTDVFEFAAFYVEQRATRGQSVQDAYKTFTTPEEGTFIPVGIADEVRDFLAKSIDEAQP